MTELVKVATSSCGCGGSCAGCGCGSPACTVSGDGCMEGPLQRPMFFSGQLLTEEDLQQLSDYAVTKFRLHNRFLHGSGVVCGLLVTCNPCGGGKVTVQPGTALDCCGNDIHLPCAVELDINEMVAQLRLEIRGGHDCGDPCAEECEDSPDDENCLDRKERRYDLFLRYCETLADPVAPYVTGGDCSPQVCKPTRVNEGYRFELRCPTKDPPPDDIFRRISACIGDLFEAEKAVRDTYASEVYGERALAARSYISSGKPIMFDDADALELDAAVELQDIDPNSEALADEGQLNRLYDRYLATAAAVVRYDLQDEAARKELENRIPNLEARVAVAREAVQASGDALKAGIDTIGPKRSRLMAEAVVNEGLNLTAIDGEPDQATSLAMRKYALGTPQSAKLLGQYRRDLSEQRDWLLSRIESKVLSSDCRLRTDLMSITIPEEAEGNEQQVVEANRKLKEILLRYLVDCICAALNPPCQPCEDPAVKLARLTVKDCDVIKICNLERTFVLSGPALRYWVPFLHLIGELFEKACCDIDIRLRQRRPIREIETSEPEQPSLLRMNYMRMSAPVTRQGDSLESFSALFRTAGIDPQTLRARVNFIGDLGRMTLPIDSIGPQVELRKRAIAEAAREKVVSSVRNDEALHSTIAAPLMEEITVLRGRLDNLSSEAATEEAVSKSIHGIRKEMDAMSKRAIDPAELRQLRKDLANQVKENKSLAARLAKVEAKKGP